MTTTTAMDILDSASVNASAAIIAEQEQQFMETMDFNEDMLALLDLDDTSSGSGQISSTCMDSMYKVGQSYRSVHGYISLIVCIAGLLMNTLIIMVLARREMRTPINRMLTALAVADTLIMAEYIPFAVHMYVFELPQQEQYSYAWAVFVLFHSHFTQVLHTINIQLTITMSIWRYVALKRNGSASRSLTMSRCNLCIVIAYLCPVLICIPNYLTFSIYHREVLILQPPLTRFVRPDATVVDTTMEASIMTLCMYASEMAQAMAMGSSDTGAEVFDCSSDALVRADWYTVGLSEVATRNGLNGINFWFYSVCVKLIPCFVLTFFMCWLINTLYKAKRRHNALHCKPPGLAPSSMAMPVASVSVTADYASLYQQGTGTGTNPSPNPSPPSLRLPSHSRHQAHHYQNCIPDCVLEEREPSNDNCDQHHEEAPPPSVVYTPVSPLLSPNRSIYNGGGSIVNPSYSSGVTYTTLSALPPSERTSNGRRGSNLGLGVPTGTTPATSSPRRISFGNTSNNSKTSNGTHVSGSDHDQRDRRSSSTATIMYPLTAAIYAMQRTRLSVGSTCTVNGHTPKKSGKRPDRTSKLLIAVLCLFLLTEFPQGIMAFLSGVYGEQFFKKCYNTWAEVWDILALINSSINFILYCFMSKQFRVQFHQLVRWRRCNSNSRDKVTK